MRRSRNRSDATKSLWTVTRLAEFCNVKPGTVYKWIERGVLHDKNGLVRLPSGLYRINPELLEDWLRKACIITGLASQSNELVRIVMFGMHIMRHFMPC